MGLCYWESISHIVLNPNKDYEYAYAGLLFRSTTHLKTLYSNLSENCILITEYNHWFQKLKYFPENIDEFNALGIKSLNFANDNLIWEKYDNTII